MQTKLFKTLCRALGTWYVLAVALSLGAAAHTASAQWTVANAAALWTGYNNAFYNLDPNDHTKAFYYHQQGGGSEEGFWTFAEEIEMAEDAAYWDKTNEPQNVTTDNNRTVALTNGFRYQHGSEWSSDPYNDDLSVAILAFVRCWELTSNAEALSDAENRAVSANIFCK